MADIQFSEGDLQVTRVRADRQMIDQSDFGVRIVHVPSGFAVTTTGGRSLLENETEAVLGLRSMLRAEEAGVIKRPVDASDPRTGFEYHLDQVFDEAKQLLLRKHHDYGPENIGRSPGGPLNGLRVRVWDKIARINNLIDKNVDPANESLRDSWLDCMNYGAIALIVMDGNWPTGEEEVVHGQE